MSATGGPREAWWALPITRLSVGSVPQLVMLMALTTEAKPTIYLIGKTVHFIPSGCGFGADG